MLLTNKKDKKLSTKTKMTKRFMGERNQLYDDGPPKLS